MSPVVDIHCHYFNSDVAATTGDLDVAAHDPLAIYGSELTRAVNADQMRDRASKLNDIDERLRDMDRMGVDVQAISPAPHQYFYFAEGRRGADIARRVNEGIAQVVRMNPRRFVGLGTVPLQDPQRAIEELDYAILTLGLRGIEINTNVNGLDLTDSRLAMAPFFQRANELNVLIFLHPLGFSQGQRLGEHYLGNVIGNPLDTTIAISHLIFEGWVERFRDLKFVAAHGGGFLPQYWGRMDHAWRARKDARQHIERAPSSYLAQFHFDTLTHSPTVLGQLIRQWGAERILLGTDYPYDMGDEDPRAFIEQVEGLSAPQKNLIQGANAARLLGLTGTPLH